MLCSVIDNAFQSHVVSDVFDDAATVIEKITANIANPLSKGSSITSVTMPNYPVAFRIVVENYSNQNLAHYEAHENNGLITEGEWPVDINSGTKEAVSGHKQAAIAYGCWGTVSWLIEDTTKMLVIMYYIPYNYISYNSMLAVGIFTRGDTSNFYNRMYDETQNDFKRKTITEANADRPLLYGKTGVNFVIMATMPYSFKPHITVGFYPTTVDRIATALKTNNSSYQCQYTLLQISYYICFCLLIYLK